MDRYDVSILVTPWTAGDDDKIVNQLKALYTLSWILDTVLHEWVRIWKQGVI